MQDPPLSDHAPFLVETHQQRWLSWNILMRMRRLSGSVFFNNGFAISHESHEAYLARLTRIADTIAEWHEQAPLDGIFLQEYPAQRHAREHFEARLLLRLGGYFAPPLVELRRHLGACLACFVDRRRYLLADDITQAMRDTTLQQGLQQRIMPLVLRVKSAQQHQLIVNVHADFTQRIVEDLYALEARACLLGLTHRFYLGDFNRDLCKPSDSYAQRDASQLYEIHHTVHGLQPLTVPLTCFIARATEPDSDIVYRLQETRDGVLSSDTARVAWPHNWYWRQLGLR